MESSALCPSIYQYWRNSLEFTEEEFLNGKFIVVSHGKDFSDYHGAFVLCIDGRTVITVPKWARHATEERIENIKLEGNAMDFSSPEFIQKCFGPRIEKIIGPAYYGYLNDMGIPNKIGGVETDATSDFPFEIIDRDAHQVQPNQHSELVNFASHVDSNDWAQSGLSIDAKDPLFGFRSNGNIAALSGYKVWGGKLAHIGIVTHQDFRGKGFGKQVLQAAAKHAIEQGLIAQYRTLRSNMPSIRIAGQLGFTDLATSIAVRFKP